MSVDWPAGNGTMMRSGLAGHAWARAGKARRTGRPAMRRRDSSIDDLMWDRPGRLGRFLLLLCRMLAGDLEEIVEDLVAVLRGDALGMELNAVDRQRLVAQAHDDVAGLGGDLELVRQALARHDQRVI